MRYKICSVTLSVSLLLLLGPWIAPAAAERYAVLIGIGTYQDYAHIPSLPGPVNDVKAFQSMLVEKYGFAPGNITVLTDSKATRQEVLASLSRLRQTTKGGDFVLIFYSGHGTSAHDERLSLGLEPLTGALLPYQIKLDKKNLQQASADLIIGKRDLRPILGELDRDRTMFVVFDACFSGNTVRSPMIGGIPKYVDISLGGSQATQARSASGGIDFGDYKPEPRFEKQEPYPYRNIIYIAASGEWETATDLPRSSYDGKAHGALTDALLRGLSGAADTNHDGVITYEELYHYARRETQSSNQTPQILHQLALNKPVFGKAATPGQTSAAPDRTYGPLSAVLRVNLQGAAKTALERNVGELAGVKMVEDENELFVKAEGTGFGLYLAGGEKLCSVETASEAVSRIEKYGKARQLMGLRNPKQNFNVWLRAGDSDGKTVFSEGETIDFTIRSEEKAHLLLLNMDSQGNVCVLLPESEHADARINKGGTFKSKSLGLVGPPFGVEFLKLFAFRESLQGLERFAAGDGVLSATEARFGELLEAVKRRSDWAETLQQVVTVKKH